MELECDALALLIVRLETDRPEHGDPRWHRWEESCGARPDGLPQNGQRSANRAPYRKVPAEADWHYFNPHIERMLFPHDDAGPTRWIRCPDRLYLELGQGGGPRREAQVELLERLSTPFDPSCSFGLIHLSLLPSGVRNAPDTRWWTNAVASPFRRHYEKFELAVVDRGETVDLPSGRPVRAIVEELFGDPHELLERSMYSVFMAPYPDELERDPDCEAAWRCQLATHSIPKKDEENGDEASPFEPIGAEREERQTFQIGTCDVLVLGKATAFTQEGAISDKFARNFRSNWTESIVYGLLQQHSLEEFQRRLAAFGDPLNRGVERLRRDWLKFRNLLWWSQLSSGAEIPQELVLRLRNELGTERIFTDLEGDLATYSEHQHEAALANIQIYGAAVAVFGALAAAIGLAGATGRHLTVLLAGAAILALLTSALVHIELKGWPRWRDAAYRALRRRHNKSGVLGTKIEL